MKRKLRKSIKRKLIITLFCVLSAIVGFYVQRKINYVNEYVSDHNTGNVIIDNIVDGKIRFEKRWNKCEERNNITFKDKKISNHKSYKHWKNKIRRFVK